MQITFYEYDSPIGELQLFLLREEILRIVLPGSSHLNQRFPLPPNERGSAIRGIDGERGPALQTIQAIKTSLDAYFYGKNIQLTNLPVDKLILNKKIYRVILSIPRGKTATYGEIAALAGIPGAARAVGQACKKNPLPLIVPCHRVVAKNGIGGFNGAPGLKEKLLALESNG